MTVQGLKSFNNHTSRINPTADLYRVPFVITASQTIDASYHGALLVINTSANITLSLAAPVNSPAVSSYNNGSNPATATQAFNGWEIGFRNAGTGIATFTSSGLINGASTLAVGAGGSGDIFSAAGAYYTKGLIAGSSGFTSSANFKVVNRTSLDCTSTTGTSVVITGVGFAPKGVMAFMSGGSVTEGNRLSIGISDGTTEDCIYRVVPTGYTGETQSGYLIIVQDVDGTTQSLWTLTSLDADGCTITCTKVGSPTGNVEVGFVFF